MAPRASTWVRHREDEAAAPIDWNDAALGPQLDDLASAVWSSSTSASAAGAWPARPAYPADGRRLRVRRPHAVNGIEDRAWCSRNPLIAMPGIS
jgi:hypothetical protein